MSHVLILALSVLSGLAFAALGVVYRGGVNRGLHTLHIVCVTCSFGALVFAAQLVLSRPPLVEPTVVLGWAVAAAVSQYLLIRLMNAALLRGPMAPLWCALMLNFVPVSLVAAFWLGETLARRHGVMLVFAALVIVAAAQLRREESAEEGAVLDVVGARKRLLVYGLLLAVAFLVNSVSNIGIKVLGMAGRPSLMEQSRAWFFAVFYAGIAALALLDLIVRRRLCPRPFLAVGLGTAAGVCSVVGMFSLSACVGAPAVTVFTTSSITGILGTAVMDTALFGEERSPAWWATLVFGVLCILASAGVLPLL